MLPGAAICSHILMMPLFFLPQPGCNTFLLHCTHAPFIVCILQLCPHRILYVDESSFGIVSIMYDVDSTRCTFLCLIIKKSSFFNAAVHAIITIKYQPVGYFSFLFHLTWDQNDIVIINHYYIIILSQTSFRLTYFNISKATTLLGSTLIISFATNLASVCPTNFSGIL